MSQMTALEQRITDQYLSYAYPDEPQQDLEAAALQATVGTLPEDTKNITAAQFGKMAMDVPAGLLKGGVQASIGLPGDLISLGRGVAAAMSPQPGEGRLDAFLRGTEGRTILPTTEDVKKFIDETLGMPLVPASETDPMRREAAKVPEFIGELGGGGKTLAAGARGAVAAGKAAAKFAAPKVGEMLDQYMRRSGLTMDLMAYHGSPVRFEKFDASKIGTGEGAQKYGYGLYFSSSPDVAGKYRLKAGDGGGSFYTVDIPDDLVKNMLDWDAPIKTQSEVIQRLAKQEGLDPDDFGGDLAFRLGVRSPEAVKLLRDQGVLGVKYFDQASRRKDKANQNFVVFPGGEDQIKILKVE